MKPDIAKRIRSEVLERSNLYRMHKSTREKLHGITDSFLPDGVDYGKGAWGLIDKSPQKPNFTLDGIIWEFDCLFDRIEKGNGYTGFYYMLNREHITAYRWFKSIVDEICLDIEHEELLKLEK